MIIFFTNVCSINERKIQLMLILTLYLIIITELNNYIETQNSEGKCCETTYINFYFVCELNCVIVIILIYYSEIKNLDGGLWTSYGLRVWKFCVFYFSSTKKSQRQNFHKSPFITKLLIESVAVI